jgi:hypothetical protein
MAGCFLDTSALVKHYYPEIGSAVVDQLWNDPANVLFASRLSASKIVLSALMIMAMVALVLTFILYSAWMNGVFLRCPHCGKIGSWRFNTAEPPVEKKDEDGVLQESTQIRICRKCAKRVLAKWSDHEGRTFEKAN